MKNKAPLSPKASTAIFFSGKIEANAGGPSGYLHNLQLGLKSIHRDFPILTPKSEDLTFYLKILRLIGSCIPIKSIRHKIRKKILRLHTKKILSSCKADTIICHLYSDLIKVSGFWKNGLIKTREPQWVLMSHSPTLPSIEKIENASHTASNSELEDIEKTKREEVEAFRLARTIIMPSPHAMDAYTQSQPKILKNKKIIYIPTGSEPVRATQEKEFLIKKIQHQNTTRHLLYWPTLVR